MINAIVLKLSDSLNMYTERGGHRWAITRTEEKCFPQAAAANSTVYRWRITLHTETERAKSRLGRVKRFQTTHRKSQQRNVSRLLQRKVY